MEPHRYQVVVKYLTAETDTCPPSLKATFKSEAEAKVVASLNPEKRYTLLNILEGKDFQGVSVSPNGKYALVKYVNRQERIVRAIDGCRYGTGLIARRKFLDNRQMDA